MSTTEVTELAITRSFEASLEEVWNAWTEPGKMRQWMAPEGISIARLEADVRVGGEYLIEMATPDGPATAVGSYREVRPRESLSYTWRWLEQDEMPESLVEVSFKATDSGTEVSLRHSGFVNSEATDGHSQGWASCLDRLAKELAG